MKNIHKLVLSISFSIFLSLQSDAQVGQLVGKLVKAASKEGKESLTIVEQGLKTDEHLIMRIDDRRLIEEIKQAHPNEDWSHIKLTETEKSKILQKQLRKQWEEDNPIEAAEVRKRQSESEDRALWSPLAHRDISAKKILEPKSFYKSVESFISIPSTPEEYKNIFKNENQALIRNTINIYHQVGSDISITGSANSFIQALSQQSSDPLTIIGHNENGILYFPNGSTLSLKQIDQIANEYQRIVVYLSCNAAQFTNNPAVNYYLDFSQALHLNSFIRYELTNCRKDITKDDLIKKINTLLARYEYNKHLKYKLKVIIFAGTGAGVVAYGVYKIEDDQ